MCVGGGLAGCDKAGYKQQVNCSNITQVYSYLLYTPLRAEK